MKKYGFFLIMIVFATQSYGLWAQNHYDKSSPGIGISNHRFILEQEKNKTLRDVIISIDQDSLYARSGENGNFTLMGTCTNNGSIAVVYVTITALFYDSNNHYLGSASTYAKGGKNVILKETDTYTNALEAGDKGFFKITSSFQYLTVGKVIYSMSYQVLDLTTAQALIDFKEKPVFSSKSGNALLEGTVKNSSATYLAYFSKVYFAVLNNANKVIDLGESDIIGYEYNYGTGTTTTALYTKETGTFSALFSVSSSEAASYLYSFEWKEKIDTQKPEKDPPFGAFETPVNFSNVSGSIPVTGWALDDKGVELVNIYRGEPGELVYLGEATFVNGARPDVAALYSDYPNNTRAGWGYMLLTNMLPNGGNGWFTLYAEAFDKSGKSTIFGTKVIICDNAHTVKPFGAIDTPTQGGTASGSEFVNYGWVLTPNPNQIAIDGSMIDVYVDSMKLGNAVYNLPRPDISTLFPGYMNTGGAGGYFFINTWNYSNGLHTIQWVARDSAGNTDGIGSRYFTVSNSTSSIEIDPLTVNLQNINTPCAISYSSLQPFRTTTGKTLHIKRGFGQDILKETLSPGANGVYEITLHELEPLEIYFETVNAPDGFEVVGEKIKALPIGSTLDKERGTFYWIPSQGFLGKFKLVFIEKSGKDIISVWDIQVEIIPKGL